MEPSKKSLLDWEVGDLCEFKDQGILIPVEIVLKYTGKTLTGETWATYTFKRYDRDENTTFRFYIVDTLYENQPECPKLQPLGTELKIN